MDRGRVRRARRRRRTGSIADDTDADADTRWCLRRKALRAFYVNEEGLLTSFQGGDWPLWR